MGDIMGDKIIKQLKKNIINTNSKNIYPISKINSNIITNNIGNYINNNSKNIFPIKANKINTKTNNNDNFIIANVKIDSKNTLKL